MKNLFTLLVAMAAFGPAHASPGAHGPNGEHLDGPVAATTAGNIPRVETFSELFEVVGHLSGGELSVMVDRYDTNEPVLNGKLEVQYKNLKAQATFHSDIGDYAIADAQFLQALAKPGKHALLFTFVHGEESDLLEGTLEVAAPAAHDHDSAWSRWWLLAAVPVLVVPAAVARLRRHRRAEVRP